MKNILAAAAAVTLTAGAALAAPVDLTSWTAENTNFGTQSPANWSVAADTHSVLQHNNSDPAVFYDGAASSQGKALSGTIEVQTTGDDDFIGFVLGFDAGELDGSAGAIDYWLVDWKQGNQTHQDQYAPAGLALSHVTGTSEADVTYKEGAELWGHVGDVSEIARGTNLHSTGWADNTVYTFDLIFTATAIQVKVNGVVELTHFGNFQDGGFGFYNYSQSTVEYAGIEEDTAPPISGVPLPAGLPLLIGAFGVLGLARRRKH